LDEQIFQEDFMKNGICFLDLPHPRPATAVGVCGRSAQRAANSYGKRFALATMIVCQKDSFCTVYEAVQPSKIFFFALFKKNSRKTCFFRFFAL
jgi:mitochondrial fission protein ELM1